MRLDYGSKCEALHGHNWLITVYLKAPALNQNGMVMDFTQIKAQIYDALDHKNLNEILPVNPTAENIARWCQERLGPLCYRVKVQESEGNIAIYDCENGPALD